MMAIVIDGRHFQGLFCSKTGFNLSQRMVSKIEIQVLEKWIGICVFILDQLTPQLKKGTEITLEILNMRSTKTAQNKENTSDS